MASIGSVGASDYAYQNAQTATVAATTTATPATTTPVATTDTKSDNTVASNSAAVYETTATDKDKTAAAAKQQRTQMLKEADEKAEQFKKLILSIVDKQGKTSAKALPDSNLKDFYQSLTVSDEDRAKAQQDISEDGYYGVKETSKRIMDMA